MVRKTCTGKEKPYMVDLTADQKQAYRVESRRRDFFLNITANEKFCDCIERALKEILPRHEEIWPRERGYRKYRRTNIYRCLSENDMEGAKAQTWCLFSDILRAKSWQKATGKSASNYCGIPTSRILWTRIKEQFGEPPSVTSLISKNYQSALPFSKGNSENGQDLPDGSEEQLEVIPETLPSQAGSEMLKDGLLVRDESNLTVEHSQEWDETTIKSKVTRKRGWGETVAGREAENHRVSRVTVETALKADHIGDQELYDAAVDTEDWNKLGALLNEDLKAYNKAP